MNLDLICELHVGLKRQGPGSDEATLKALGFIDGLDKISKAADLGCGTGGQTTILAGHIAGNVTGVDLFPDFIDALNKTASELNQKVTGVVGSMTELSFGKGELDLIWSEGAIDAVGFENGLTYWHDFLRKDGYVAVTCPSWLTDERPKEIEKFWSGAGSKLDTVGDNINILQKAGYALVAAFVLPEKCWADNYFVPREAAGKALSAKYAGNETVRDFIAAMNYEMELYAKYKRFYGYVFYIGKKTAA